jgi:prepilin-type N-terminal cleavage/methylation domain-containing protein
VKSKLSGFTLIELLIVVAIIAILAAIAVPNFLEAQTRAKVSRVKSDLRSMGTALEMYTIDHNKQPLDYNVSKGGDPQPPGAIGSPSGILHPGCVLAGGQLRAGLTTPVSYITNCWVQDPFVGKSGGNLNFDEQVYTYNPFWKGKLWNRQDTAWIPSNYISSDYYEFYGTYRLGSIGPDRDFYNGAGFSTNRHSVVYDASNGTISKGNIWRSQKDSEVQGRPKKDPA